MNEITAKIWERIADRLYPTATIVFASVTAVVFTALHQDWLDSETLENIVLGGWINYLGAFTAFLFRPAESGVSEATGESPP